jgi:hypothetical protein
MLERCIKSPTMVLRKTVFRLSRAWRALPLAVAALDRSFQDAPIATSGLAGHGISDGCMSHGVDASHCSRPADTSALR